ncbi:MAG: tetratricopeptide repeat protein, partial [Candidatus Hodarchaeota archaeon]
VRINQSSLSKNMNELLENGYVKKEDSNYSITQLGKVKYSRMLKEYNLDRQTILEDESKRIKEITEKTVKLFEKYGIKDNEIKFRFLNNIINLPYVTIESPTLEEEEFNKFLLFLSINHPDRYPQHISTKDFATDYDIEESTIIHLLLKIVKNEIFSLKIFELELDDNKSYYFLSNERLEKMLRAVVDDHITKFTYLNNLNEESSAQTNIMAIKNEILDDICGQLFHDGLRNALSRFIPKYIDHLAYKMEREEKLSDLYDKLEVLIWQNVRKFQSKVSSELESYYSKIEELMYKDRYKEVLNVLDEMLEKFVEDEIDIQMKKASVLKKLRKIEAGLDIIKELIKKYPKNNNLLSYEAYWYQYLDRENESLEIMNEIIKQEPKNPTFHDMYGEILMNFKKYDNAINQFLKVMEIDQDEGSIYQISIKLGTCYKELEKYQLAAEYLEKGKRQAKRSSDDNETIKMWNSIAELFLTEIKFILEYENS